MDGWILVLLAVAAVVLLAVVEYRAADDVYGWLDVRTAHDADEVRRDIEEYGPDAPGLKLGLLPPQERQAVLAERARARAAHHHRLAHR